MNDKIRRDVLNKNIQVEGCDFAENALRFARVDEATLARASACLQVVERCKEWWWGDFLVAYAQWRLEKDYSAQELTAMSEQDQHEKRCGYVRNHGSVLMGDQNEDTQRHRYMLSNFYKTGMRIPELTPWHHRVAMDGSDGDPAIAHDWLDRAKANNWSGNELRYHIGKAKKAALPDPPVKVESLQHELFGACRWASATAKRVPDMELEEIDRTLANLAPLLALAQALAEQRKTLAGGGQGISSLAA